MNIPPADAKPPGRKLIKRMSTRTKWLLLTPAGLLLISYGLCVFSEAGHLKHTGQRTVEWVLLGIYSLVLINAGIVLFGQAVRFRVLMDTRREIRRSLRRMDKRKARRKDSKK